ncbi:hypothetical protein ACWD0A_21040 [Streptomyces sp. NPDC002867]
MNPVIFQPPADQRSVTVMVNQLVVTDAFDSWPVTPNRPEHHTATVAEVPSYAVTVVPAGRPADERPAVGRAARQRRALFAG